MQLTSAFLGRSFQTKWVNPSTPTSQNAPRQVTCMAKKKGVRCIITLECTEARAEGATPSRYVTQKNRKNTPERLEIKKYNKFLRRMTVHKEIK
uniref:Large subunit ribosomal protein L33 n=1 Tax=Tetraselmis sp. GSL018 TaxID=582737 RepID=A0A061RX87_9CHLO|mmetsp:Transcript_2058/g.4864  ORF Transcript_2058/g.4864 Transcript_2058/m.4864 type:complete len:94 (+) Transcript_2058:103-384(+)